MLIWATADQPAAAAVVTVNPEPIISQYTGFF
jgi:hypothetical protein